MLLLAAHRRSRRRAAVLPQQVRPRQQRRSHRAWPARSDTDRCRGALVRFMVRQAAAMPQLACRYLVAPPIATPGTARRLGLKARRTSRARKFVSAGVGRTAPGPCRPPSVMEHLSACMAVYAVSQAARLLARAGRRRQASRGARVRSGSMLSCRGCDGDEGTCPF